MNKAEIVAQFSPEKKTGLTEVQIAIFSDQIKQLSEHFNKHPKDNHSRIGLFRHIQKRKKLLTYLKRKDFARYQSIIKKLSIRG